MRGEGSEVFWASIISAQIWSAVHILTENPYYFWISLAWLCIGLVVFAVGVRR